MSLVTEILSAELLDELWKNGFTIVKRQGDPFEIDPKLIPRGMAYQWNALVEQVDVVRPTGWTPVPYSRHEGVFGPWGRPGNAQIGGLVLCEKSKEEVDRHTDEAHAAAYKNVTDWLDKQGAAGFSGGVTIANQTRLGRLDDLVQRKVGEDVHVDPASRTIETTTKIPAEMIGQVSAIFAERDRLEATVVRPDRTLVPGEIADKLYAAVDADKSAPWWPTLRAILLPIAVENVRKNLGDKQPPKLKEVTDE